MKRVTPAISKGIADNKDTMIDALYPIMGGMISKYVTQAIKELMDKINHKIEDGLSFEKYKRKAKAKLSGVSETELLLEESSDAVISSLFVIHKDSGLLIAEANAEDKEISDPHMVASMASAIKDFINDWVQSNTSQNEVQILSYGNATLYIESAGTVYVIAFLDAEPDAQQRTHINTFFAKIVSEYADFFQTYDGDDSSKEVEELSALMDTYLKAQTPKPEKELSESKSNFSKYFLYFLVLLVLLFIGYRANQWYAKHTLETMVLDKTGQYISIDEKEDVYVLRGNVDTVKQIRKIEALVNKASDLKVDNHLLVPLTALDDARDKVDEKLDYLERSVGASLNVLQEKILHLQEALDGSDVHFTKVIASKNKEITLLKAENAHIKSVIDVEDEIFAMLDKIFSSKPYYNTHDHALDFRHLKLFSASETEYNPEAMAEVGKIFEIYLGVLKTYKPYLESITIEGHSDSTGKENENKILSAKRAEVTKQYLKTLKSVKQYGLESYMKMEAFGSTQAIVVDGVEDKEASRRIKIKFKLNKNKIVKQVKKIVHD